MNIFLQDSDFFRNFASRKQTNIIVKSYKIMRKEVVED